MKPTRRDLLFLGAGAVAAVPFTPAPWKLLDDASIWTQNFPWIPVPARGEPSVKFTSCTLCGAGCGLKARCIGGRPVGIAPVKNHPVDRGGLCANAYGAHQMPWHAGRLTHATLRGQAAPPDEVFATLKARLAEPKGTVVVMDARPGRIASRLSMKFAAAHQGLYVTTRRAGEGASRWLAEWSKTAEPLGIDLENARTVVSLGAPVLDGWGTPGRVLSLWKRRSFELVQIEEKPSRTAALADHWIAAPTPAGVEELETLLAGLKLAGPVVVVGDAMLAAVWTARRGMVGQAGGYLARRPLPGAAPALAETPLENVPDASVGLLFLDGEAAAWARIEPKLAPGALVVSLSAYSAGLAAQAGCAIPAPAFLESLDDVPAPFDATRASLALSPQMVTAFGATMAAHDVFARLEGWPESCYEDALTAQIEALHAARRGTVFVPAEGAEKKVAEVEGAAKLKELLLAGAVWVDEAAPQTLRCEAPKEPSYGLVPFEPAWRPAVLPPLATKIYQESTLRSTREA